MTVQFLKLSTAASLVVGPVLDSAGAEYASAVIGDISLSKNGGTLTALAATATLTYIANGHYTLALTTGNTDTLGRADLLCNKAGYQMPPVRLTVLAAVPFDTIITNGTLASTTSGRTLVVDASGLADANAVKVGPTGSGTAQTARDLGASVLLSSGTGTGQLDFTGGVTKANATQWLGGTIPAVSVTGVPLVDAKYLLGTIFSTPTVAGVPNVNAKTWNDLATVALPLTPTTAGRALDVSAGGEAGLDWANVGGPTTTLALPNTTVGTVTTYTGDTPQTGDAYAQTNSGTFGLAAIKGYVDDIGVAGAGLTALGDARIANLDAAVTTRMATYTQPTGFLAATFPTTLASTTNITAGTITTVTTTTTATNLTNAPTAGDFTSAMKTSLNAATPASVVGAVGSVTGAVGSVTGNVGGMTASGWATAFTTDTTKAFADAVEGSLVKEVADGVASGGGTVDANLVSVNGTTFAGANVPAVLADGVAHGGTTAKLRLGSTTSTPALHVTNSGGSAVTLAATGFNTGLVVSGNPAAALSATTGNALSVLSTGAAAVDVTSTTSGGVSISAGGGAGLTINSADSPGVSIIGAGVSGGLRIAGDGTGHDILLDGDGILGGNLSGSVGSVTGLSTSTIAVAVRDVSNSSPAAGSLGEAVRGADAKAAVLIDTVGAPAGATVSADVAAVKAKTDLIPASPAAVGSAMTLANGAVTEASISQPGEAAGRPTTFLAKVQRLFEWGSNKRTRNKTTGVVTLRDEADAATLETQTQSTVEPVDTQSKGV